MTTEIRDGRSTDNYYSIQNTWEYYFDCEIEWTITYSEWC